jgi:hypothetical protein
MSRFTDLAAADLRRLTGATSDMGGSVTLGRRGQTTGTSVLGVMGDPDPTMVQISAGVEDRRQAQFVAVDADVVAVLGRRAERGDWITVAAGAYVGRWTVDRAQADDGGGVVIYLTQADLHAPGAQGAREVRA